MYDHSDRIDRVASTSVSATEPGDLVSFVYKRSDRRRRNVFVAAPDVDGVTHAIDIDEMSADEVLSMYTAARQAYGAPVEDDFPVLRVSRVDPRRFYSDVYKGLGLDSDPYRTFAHKSISRAAMYEITFTVERDRPPEDYGA